MSEITGLFISMEGGDASGKMTQSEMLVNRLRNSGDNVLPLDFPQYETPIGVLIKRMLSDPSYGSATALNPRLASHMYALDRHTAAPAIHDALNSGTIVITNRFSASNMAHQGAKFGGVDERQRFYDWAYQLEHEQLGLPFPQHVLLHLPAAVAHERLVRRGEVLDDHERNLDYQRRSETAYLEVVAKFAGNFSVVECMDGDREKSRDEIHEEVWQTVEDLRA